MATSHIKSHAIFLVSLGSEPLTLGRYQPHSIVGLILASVAIVLTYHHTHCRTDFDVDNETMSLPTYLRCTNFCIGSECIDLPPHGIVGLILASVANVLTYHHTALPDRF